VKIVLEKETGTEPAANTGEKNENAANALMKQGTLQDACEQVRREPH
jgi:hypothetical protein